MALFEKEKPVDVRTPNNEDETRKRLHLPHLLFLRSLDYFSRVSGKIPFSGNAG